MVQGLGLDISYNSIQGKDFGMKSFISFQPKSRLLGMGHRCLSGIACSKLGNPEIEAGQMLRMVQGSGSYGSECERRQDSDIGTPKVFRIMSLLPQTY